MAGIPLMALNEGLRMMAGFLYRWKLLILLLLLALSVPVYRPFCRYLCPLGAVYGLFHPITFLRICIDAKTCTSCGACSQACKMGVDVLKNPNRMECIRCGECVHACPQQAIQMGMRVRKTQRKNQNRGKRTESLF